MAETLSLGGREYQRAGADITVRQDLWVMMQARHAGLAGCAAIEGESAEAFAERLLASCLASGRALLLLGGLIVPAGSTPSEWTEETAHATAAHLGGITERDDKLAVYAEFASALLGFFKAGHGSWISSERSSQRAVAGRPNSTGDTESGPA